MTNAKTTKRALLSSVMTLLVCVSMLIGTTFAWFTDSVTSGVNRIVAGNVDIELWHQNSNSGSSQQITDGSEDVLFQDISLWEPGVVGYETFTVKNVGSLALNYQLSFNISDETIVDGHGLSEALKVGVTTESVAGKTREEVIGLVEEGDWTPLNSFSLSGGLLANTDADPVTVILYWQPGPNDNYFNMNNENQGKVLSINIGVTLVAGQKMEEFDSFDEKYDYSAFVQVTPDTFEQILANLKDGDQLYLQAGTYKVSANERLKIVNDNVTIVGAGVNSTIIDAEDKTCSGQAAFMIDGNNVTLKNLTVKTSSTNGSVAAIKVANLSALPRIVSGGTIENVVVYGGAGHGINLHGVDGVTIKTVDVRSFGKCAFACAMATNVTISGTKTAVGGWNADLGVMYGSGDAYATPSTIIIKADNSFSNGTVYTERPASAPGGVDTLTFENPSAWAKWVNGDQTLYLAAAASIGDVGYATLQDAINNAVAGDTVKLNADILATLPNNFGSANTAVFSIEKSIILDGNNKTITVDTGNWDMYNNGKTGNILSIGVGDAALGTTIDKNVEATVKNLTIVGNASYMKNGISIYQAAADGATTKATLDNVKVSDCGAASIQVNRAALTVNGADSDIARGAWNYAIGVDNGGSLIVENGNIEIIQVGTGTCQINGGTVAVASEENLNATLDFVNPDSTNVTLALATDIEVSEQVEIRKAITLDGNNYTVSGSTNYSVPEDDTGKKYLIACYAPVTVKNITLAGNDSAAFGLQFYKTAGGKVTDVTLKNFKLGLCVNAANVSATGSISQENIAWGGINVSYGSSVTFANPGFDASAATLSGVSMIYSDPSDVANANAKGQSITIVAPNGWTDQSSGGYIVFAPQG